MHEEILIAEYPVLHATPIKSGGGTVREGDRLFPKINERSTEGDRSMGFNVSSRSRRGPASGLRDGTHFRDRSVLHAFKGTPASSGLFPHGHWRVPLVSHGCCFRL